MISPLLLVCAKPLISSPLILTTIFFPLTATLLEVLSLTLNVKLSPTLALAGTPPIVVVVGIRIPVAVVELLTVV